MASLSLHAGSGVLTADLANGIRVRHRQMPRAGADGGERVLLRLSVLGGALDETHAQRGLSEAAASAWRFADDPPEGMVVSSELWLDALECTVDVPAEEVEAALSWLAGLLTEPRVSDRTLALWRADLAEQRAATRWRAEAALSVAMGERIVPRRCAAAGLLTDAEAGAISASAAQSRLDELRTRRAVTLSVVGPIGRERAVLAAAAALGGLEARPTPESLPMDAWRACEPPAEGVELRVSLEPRDAGSTAGGDGEGASGGGRVGPGRALVLVGAFGIDAWSLRELRAATAAGQVLADRLDGALRADGAETGEPDGGAGASDGAGGAKPEAERAVWAGPAGAWPVYPGWGILAVQAVVPAERVEGARGRIEAELARFAAEGPTPEELTRVRERIAAVAARSALEPEVWLERLSKLDRWPAGLDALVAMRTEYQSLSGEELRAAVDRVWNRRPRVAAVVRPPE